MRLFQYVTFQAPTEVRSSAGDVSYTYANVADLTDLPARVHAVAEEKRGEQLVTVTDRFNIIVAGDRTTIEPEMAVQDGEAVYDVIRVLTPTMGRRGRRLTVVEAKRVAI